MYFASWCSVFFAALFIVLSIINEKWAGCFVFLSQCKDRCTLYFVSIYMRYRDASWYDTTLLLRFIFSAIWINCFNKNRLINYSTLENHIRLLKTIVFVCFVGYVHVYACDWYWRLSSIFFLLLLLLIRFVRSPSVQMKFISFRSRWKKIWFLNIYYSLMLTMAIIIVIQSITYFVLIDKYQLKNRKIYF